MGTDPQQSPDPWAEQIKRQARTLDRLAERIAGDDPARAAALRDLARTLERLAG